MPTEAKRETVAELREELAERRTLIVSEYRGLKVSELAEIRRALRKQDVTYRVVKNRLMRIAADGHGRRGPQRRCSIGPTAIAFGQRRGRDRQGRPRRDPAVQGRPDQGRRPGRPGDRRRRRHPAGRAAVARGPAGQAGRRRCRRRSATLAGLLAAPLRNLGYALAAGRRPEGRASRLSA